ncbi:MAG: UDP-glucose 4-epimerase GalE [Alphaproteobacteria bacterium]|nr:UDP-glucose 4-epimerase GalE [Alphaproteobacteria bacterium]
MGAEKPCVLVTGGAGYIGGQTVLCLLDYGFEVCVLDDLSTGRRLPMHDATHFYEGKVQNKALVEDIIKRHDVGAVLHFAGSIKVDESVSNPLKYYSNNTDASRLLLEAVVGSGVNVFIFSSTAAVYGATGESPVDEDWPASPLNPYGWSKLFTERQLMDVAAASNLKYGIFRYFNVAGADTQLRHGQYLERPAHLIGRAIDALLGNADPITVFGNNLPTHDGTGVRDYIHVCDVADAHVALLKYLLAEETESRLFNLGYGRGYSVLDVFDNLLSISGLPVPYSWGAPRAGEAPSVIANSDALKVELGWCPKHDDLTEIVKSAYDWQRSLLKK